MRKLYLTIMIGILLVGTILVSAIVIGNILTQDQLDNQDVMNTDLEESFMRDENNKVIHNKSGSEEIFYVNILSIDKEFIPNETLQENVWSGDYIIVEREFEIAVDINRWKERRDEVGIEQAKEELKEWLKAKKSRIEQNEKRRIMEFQTNIDNLNDFNLEDLVI